MPLPDVLGYREAADLPLANGHYLVIGFKARERDLQDVGTKRKPLLLVAQIQTCIINSASMTQHALLPGFGPRFHGFRSPVKFTRESFQAQAWRARKSLIIS